MKPTYLQSTIVTIIIMVCLYGCATISPAVGQATMASGSPLTIEESRAVIDYAMRGLPGTVVVFNHERNAWLFVELTDRAYNLVLVSRKGTGEVLSTLRGGQDTLWAWFDSIRGEGWQRVTVSAPAIQAALRALGATMGDFIFLPVTGLDRLFRKEYQQ